MDATVDRHFFFDAPGGGSLRYTEEWPRDPHVHEGGCGCTRGVSVRPDGEPSLIQQGIEVRIDEDWFFNLQANWLVWKQYAADPHAYFRVEKDAIHMEIHRPNYGLVDYFFAHIYQGPSVDVSRLFQGHCPPDPKVVDLSKVGPKTLWIYEGRGEHQAMRIFGERDKLLFDTPSLEVLDLQTALMLGHELRRYAEPLLSDHETPVFDLRQKVLSHLHIPSYIEDMKRCFERYVSYLQITEVFRLSREVSLSTHPKDGNLYPSV